MDRTTKPTLVVKFLFALLMLLNVTSRAKAADRLDAGAVLSIVKANKTSGILGLGGSIGYEFLPGIGAEAELARGVGIGDGPSGEFLATFGIRAGTQFHPIGLFAVVRPGFLRCGEGNCGVGTPPPRTFLATFIGGACEVSGGGRSFFRADFGDTMIDLQQAPGLGGSAPAGLIHNKTVSGSVGVKF